MFQAGFKLGILVTELGVHITKLIPVILEEGQSSSNARIGLLERGILALDVFVLILKLGYTPGEVAVPVVKFLNSTKIKIVVAGVRVAGLLGVSDSRLQECNLRMFITKFCASSFPLGTQCIDLLWDTGVDTLLKLLELRP